jgi:hypothetical protein
MYVFFIWSFLNRSCLRADIDLWFIDRWHARCSVFFCWGLLAWNSFQSFCIGK